MSFPQCMLWRCLRRMGGIKLHSFLILFIFFLIFPHFLPDYLYFLKVLVHSFPIYILCSQLVMLVIIHECKSDEVEILLLLCTSLLTKIKFFASQVKYLVPISPVNVWSNKNRFSAFFSIFNENFFPYLTPIPSYVGHKAIEDIRVATSSWVWCEECV